MVRHGRLSQGCETCRKRKIKCDRMLPACTQCLKSSWPCPQYGDLRDRMFQYHDRRAFKATVDPELPKSETWLLNPPNKQRASDSCSSFESVISTAPTASSQNFPLCFQYSVNKISPEIIPPANSRAIDFFLSIHTFRDCGVPRGYYEYLSVFINGIGTSPTLVTSLSAVSLAAYAYTRQSSDLLKEARRHYGFALRLVGTALSSPEETIKSSTLSSILLLGTFDTITGEKNYHSSVPLASHMTAATSILGLNGHALVKSGTCLQLMLHVCWNLLQICITYSSRIPNNIMNLRKHAASALDTNDPGWKLFDVVVRVSQVRADIKEGILAENESILRAALDLDSELASFADDMPSEWLFKSIPIKQMSELVLGTCYHVYPDQWVAHVWNHLRTARLLLHKEIRSALAEKLAVSHQSSFSATNVLTNQRSTRILHQMIAEICATVPQFSGYVDMLASDQIHCPSQNCYSSGIDSLTNGIPTTAGVYLLLFPLLNAGQTTELDTQRNWIVERARSIGKATGIQQAFVFADAIEMREKI